MLILTLDDAVTVTKQLVADDMDDAEIIRQELEQKCWFPPKSDDAAKHLNDLIFDINPAEICSQIESDNLKQCCDGFEVGNYHYFKFCPNCGCRMEGEENET